MILDVMLQSRISVYYFTSVLWLSTCIYNTHTCIQANTRHSARSIPGSAIMIDVCEEIFVSGRFKEIKNVRQIVGSAMKGRNVNMPNVVNLRLIH
jgi:hypothetical protein